VRVVLQKKTFNGVSSFGYELNLMLRNYPGHCSSVGKVNDSGAGVLAKY